MTATATPFGLNPIRHLNGKFVPPPMAMLNGILSTYNTDIFYGGPVTLNSNGTINASTTNQAFYGVFAGWQGATSTTALMTPLMKWDANTAYVTNVPMYAYVWNDPGIVYEMQANGSLAQTSVGDEADFINPGSGNTTGRSTTALSTTLVGVGVQGQMRIIGLSSRIDNAWGDAYTIVETVIARSQYFGSVTAV